MSAAATAPAAAGPALAGPIAHRGLITGSIMLSTIMQALDTTIANVALPHMQGSLSATQDQISWVLTSYIIAAAIMTPPTGFLADRFGRKRLFLWAVGGFTLVSMLCGIASSLPEMVAFRLLQGVFGASLIPLSQSVLLDTYPREQHGRAMAIWGIGVMVGPIVGPSLGGWLTEYYNWRWVFYINLPFGALALTGILLYVPETPRRHRPFDVFGFAMLSLAIGSLQLMLDRGELKDWFSSSEIVIEAGIAALCFYMFVVHAFTAEHPFLDPHLFADRNFVTALVFIFLVGIVLLATLALLPPFLQNLAGFPVLTTGTVLAPRGIGTMFAMTIVGRLIGKVDQRILILWGLSLTSFSLWQMTGFTPAVSTFTIVSTGMLQGFGLGFIFVPLSTLAFATLQPRLRTEAASLFSLIRNVGSSVGISMVTVVLSQSTQINHAQLAEHANPFNPNYRAPFLPQGWSLSDPAGLAAIDQAVNMQAATIAYLNDFRLMMYVTLAAIPMLLFLRPPRRVAPSPG